MISRQVNLDLPGIDHLPAEDQTKITFQMIL